jgi:hypothetical protein
MEKVWLRNDVGEGKAEVVSLNEYDDMRHLINIIFH